MVDKSRSLNYNIKADVPGPFGAGTRHAAK